MKNKEKLGIFLAIAMVLLAIFAFLLESESPEGAAIPPNAIIDSDVVRVEVVSVRKSGFNKVNFVVKNQEHNIKKEFSYEADLAGEVPDFYYCEVGDELFAYLDVYKNPITQGVYKRNLTLME